MLEYFEDLGKRIDDAWRRANFNVAAFPTICCETLESAPGHRSISTSDIVDWAVSSARLPVQHDPQAKFGEPPVTTYVGEGFFVAVNLWLTSTPAIHNHSFSGGFQVLDGGSLETTYRFKPTRVVNDYMAVGTLEESESGVLRAGATRPIVAGRTIHSLFHLENPSTTIVVRTGRDPRAAPQYTYHRPSVALDPEYNPSDLVRRTQLLTFISRSAPERLVSTCLRYVETADLVSKFAVLRHCTTLLSPEEGDILIYRARSVDAWVANLVADVIESSRREAFLIRRRVPVTDADLRFFLAILLNVRGRAGALALVRARYSERDPVDLILEWVRRLGESAAPGDAGGSALGFPLDDVVLATLEGALRDRSNNDVGRSVEKLAGRALAKRELADLAELRGALGRSEIFRYLLQ